MKIHEKMAYVRRHIESVTRHDDADSIVRLAACDQMVKFIETERAAISERAMKQIVDAEAPAVEPSAQ